MLEDDSKKLSSSWIDSKIGTAFVTLSSLDFWLSVLVPRPDLYKFPDLKYIQEYNTYLNKCLLSFECSTLPMPAGQEE